ncbi:MAG: carbonic anhydrase [Candidatus Endonucleobacter bathymodioli]|uniref:Carbonic anhydrase n=1 Tax=Candidatus Endonucleibacter bathymodioli TaxID=539814 RepID=A0AA90NXC8_9GAMM|nr:carbonic anhydrase [Candidatus Endonucleobacter bathymodioli]
MVLALEALERLKSGNKRFTSGAIRQHKLISPNQLKNLPLEQAPFAIILGCSDARVPAELIFDQGVGDLFVIRVAGNIVAPSQVGSVEFAAERFGVKLVVVLGHTHCGAISATIEAFQQPASEQSPNIHSIIKRINRSVIDVLKTEHDTPKILMQKAVHANINASVNHLRHGSEVLEQLTKKNNLLIMGAEYSLDTMVVHFFNEVP